VVFQSFLRLSQKLWVGDFSSTGVNAEIPESEVESDCLIWINLWFWRQFHPVLYEDGDEVAPSRSLLDSGGFDITFEGPIEGELDVWDFSQRQKLFFEVDPYMLGALELWS